MRGKTPLLLRFLNLIADADSRYRQKQKLKNLPDERLEDMGMTRRDADMAFYQRGSNHPREQWQHPIRTR